MKKIFKIVIAIIFIILGSNYKKWIVSNKLEHFRSYIQPTYKHVKTGSEPMGFYVHPRYRKPYRWPFTFYKSYPYPHMSPYDDE